MGSRAVAIPDGPAELSAEFLTQALRSAGALPEGEVTALRWDSVGDAGQTGLVVRVVPTYEGADHAAPTTLIAKFATPFEQARAHMHALGLYQREVRFYQDFGADAGISVPRCFYADIDDQTGNFALLLEDVGQGRNGDWWNGSVEDTELAVRHLAAFHAKWWEHEKIKSTAWLRQPDDMPYYRDALGPLLPAFIPVAQQKFPRCFSGYILRTAQRLVERWPQFVAPRPEERYTLAHCDFHPKQLFFPRGTQGRFAVFDWQGTCVQLAAIDLHRILLTGLTPVQLIEHQERLIALYHRTLVEHGVRYPFEQLVSETWRSTLWTLWIVVFAVATTDLDIVRRDAEAHGGDLEQRFIGDIAIALEHFDVLARIP
jgi:hypothetical protein